MVTLFQKRLLTEKLQKLGYVTDTVKLAEEELSHWGH